MISVTAPRRPFWSFPSRSLQSATPSAASVSVCRRPRTGSAKAIANSSPRSRIAAGEECRGVEVARAGEPTRVLPGVVAAGLVAGRGERLRQRPLEKRAPFRSLAARRFAQQGGKALRVLRAERAREDSASEPEVTLVGFDLRQCLGCELLARAGPARVGAPGRGVGSAPATRTLGERQPRGGDTSARGQGMEQLPAGTLRGDPTPQRSHEEHRAIRDPGDALYAVQQRQNEHQVQTARAPRIR